MENYFGSSLFSVWLRLLCFQSEILFHQDYSKVHGYLLCNHCLLYTSKLINYRKKLGFIADLIDAGNQFFHFLGTLQQRQQGNQHAR